jgi:hypothetical protein
METCGPGRETDRRFFRPVVGSHEGHGMFAAFMTTAPDSQHLTANRICCFPGETASMGAAAK